MKTIRILLAVVCMLAGLALHAGTFTVTNPNNTGAGSLRQAFADAALAPGGDIVVFDPAVFNGEAEDTIVLTSEIEVADAHGVTLDASALSSRVTITDPFMTTSWPNHRFFSVASGSFVTMIGLELIDGGGIEFGGNGGAINNEGALFLTNCSFSGFGSDHGGAICNIDGALTLSHCTFEKCYAGNGGALLSLNGSMTLSHCTLSGNIATSNGGGAIECTGTVTLTACTLRDNSARLGGAVTCYSGTLTLKYCTLTGNFSRDNGGGVCIKPDADVNLTHCTVHGNHDRGSVGAIHVDGGVLTLANSIVAGTTGGGADIHNDGTLTRTGSNLVENLVNDGTAIVQGFGTISNAAPKLLSPGSYGGPTQTMPPLPDSPAIDAAVAVDGATSDQRGAPLTGALRDIGAVELGQTIVTYHDDENNGLNTGGRSLREALTDPAPFGSELVRFQHGRFHHATIDIDSEVVVSKALTFVDASTLRDDVTIKAKNINRIFRVQSGSVLHLKDFILTGGEGLGQSLFYERKGGAIVNSGIMVLERCAFHGNSAEFDGGAIYNEGEMTMTQCTLSGNTAGFMGGAVLNDHKLTLKHCTLSGNSAARGGAIAGYYSTLTLVHSIVAGNSGTIGPDIENVGGFVIAGGTNVIGNNQTVEGPFPEGPLAGTPAVPLNAQLGPLGEYGSSTKTIALKPGSPARNAAAGSAVTSDQRGFPIIGTPDIGAYEAGTLNRFDAWVYETLPANATAAQRAIDFDFDGDGRSNLVEYATLTDGATSDHASPGFTLNAAGTQATFTFPVRFDAPDIYLIVERGTMLRDWTGIYFYDGEFKMTHTADGVSASITDTGVTLTDTSIAGEPKAFYQLLVTQPSP